jgi:hypothetical protein
VGPLAIYISTIGLLLLMSIAVMIWKHTPTRKCHLCGAQVELGRRRCQACGYEFIN